MKTNTQHAPQENLTQERVSMVLRSGNVALRFIDNYGGAPLEWWSEPFPLLTNSFPGSGASVAWNTGQDPTQASANGLLNHSIAKLNPEDIGMSVEHNNSLNYYIRETLADPAGRYQVQGFAPDFWLSAEAADDAIAPRSNGGDTGWRTKYQPGACAGALNSPGCPVIFEGTAANPSGMMFVGHELFGGNWSERLRPYNEGRVAFKMNLKLNGEAIGGVCFRKTVNFNAENKDDAFNAPGLHWLFNSRGGVELIEKMRGGGERKLWSYTLPPQAFSKLVGYGLPIECRSDNNRPHYLEFYINGVNVMAGGEVTDAPPGPHLALFAQAPAGSVVFSDRQVFHVGIEFSALYESLGNGEIRSDIEIRNAPGVTGIFKYWRANTPALFLNQTTFPLADRLGLGIRSDGTRKEINGVALLSDFKSFWAGNKAGTCGVLATVEKVEVDGLPSPAAHVFLHKAANNGEFVIMLNPLRQNSSMNLRKIRMVTRWKTKI